MAHLEHRTAYVVGCNITSCPIIFVGSRGTHEIAFFALAHVTTFWLGATSQLQIPVFISTLLITDPREVQSRRIVRKMRAIPVCLEIPVRLIGYPTVNMFEG